MNDNRKLKLQLFAADEMQLQQQIWNPLFL